MTLRRKRNGPRPFQRQTQAGQHRQVSVKLDALQAPNPERRESEVVFQA